MSFILWQDKSLQYIVYIIVFMLYASLILPYCLLYMPFSVGVSCGAPGIPSNGKVNTSAGTFFGDVARYLCDTGYTLSGPAERTCQANRTWNGSVPTCESEICSVVINFAYCACLMDCASCICSCCIYVCPWVIYLTHILGAAAYIVFISHICCMASCCGNLYKYHHYTVQVARV